MGTAGAHPTVSRVWADQEDIRKDLESVRSLVAELSELDDEEGSDVPATGSATVRRMLAGLAARLRQHFESQENDRDFSLALDSWLQLRQQWSQFQERRQGVQQSLLVLVELLCGGDRPDTTGWPEIESRLLRCESALCECLADEFDLIRRGLDREELFENEAAFRRPR